MQHLFLDAAALFSAFNSSSQIGQYLCSPEMYPCFGQMEKVGVMVMYGRR
jgi:hypothetical protein